MYFRAFSATGYQGRNVHASNLSEILMTVYPFVRLSVSNGEMTAAARRQQQMEKLVFNRGPPVFCKWATSNQPGGR